MSSALLDPKTTSKRFLAASLACSSTFFRSRPPCVWNLQSTTDRYRRDIFWQIPVVSDPFREGQEGLRPCRIVKGLRAHHRQCETSLISSRKSRAKIHECSPGKTTEHQTQVGTLAKEERRDLGDEQGRMRVQTLRKTDSWLVTALLQYLVACRVPPVRQGAGLTRGIQREGIETTASRSRDQAWRSRGTTVTSGGRRASPDASVREFGAPWVNRRLASQSVHFKRRTQGPDEQKKL